MRTVESATLEALMSIDLSPPTWDMKSRCDAERVSLMSLEGM